MICSSPIVYNFFHITLEDPYKLQKMIIFLKQFQLKVEMKKRKKKKKKKKKNKKKNEN